MLKSFQLDNPFEAMVAATVIMHTFNKVVRSFMEAHTVDMKEFTKWRDETSAMWKEAIDAVDEIRPYVDLFTEEYLVFARDNASKVYDATLGKVLK